LRGFFWGRDASQQCCEKVDWEVYQYAAIHTLTKGGLYIDEAAWEQREGLVRRRRSSGKEVSLMNEEVIRPKLFEGIDLRFNEQVGFLQGLVRIPTVNPPGHYREIVAFIRSRFENSPARVDVIETDPEVCKSADVDPNEPRFNMLLDFSDGAPGPRILLLAHSDTVPVGDLEGWRHDPFGGEVEDGKLYGRGACDCKGRIAAYLYAALVLKNTLGKLPGRLIVGITADEETGGETGAKHLLSTGKLDCDYCIGEGYTWEVYHGFKGLLWLRLSIRGVSAHGATPQSGRSVVQAFPELFAELRDYQRKLSSSDRVDETTMNIGTIRAGSKINMVPDQAGVEIDFRVGKGHAIGQIVGDISSIVAKLEHSHPGLSFKLDVINKSEPVSLPRNHHLVKTVRDSAQEVLRRTVPVGLWFAHSDTLHFLRKGIPSVNYGVGRAGVAHAADEHVHLNDLKMSTKAVALSVLRLMDGGVDPDERGAENSRA